MNITWVLGLPSGDEIGEYVTIDLGGTNLRVCRVALKGQGEEIDIKQHVYRLPPAIKTGGARQLWNFIADSLDEFIKSHQIIANRDDRCVRSTYYYLLLTTQLAKYDVNRLPLGFCLSYPASQDAIDHGILKTWTKGFDIDGVEGEDAAAQLQDVLAGRVRRL